MVSYKHDQIIIIHILLTDYIWLTFILTMLLCYTKLSNDGWTKTTAIKWLKYYRYNIIYQYQWIIW